MGLDTEKIGDGISGLGKKFKDFLSSDKFKEATGNASDKAVDLIKQLGSSKDGIFESKLIDNYILFTNASGGTGVSTIVSNVAYTAATKGIKTIVIDLNIMCPMQHTFLNLKQSLDEKPDLVSYINGHGTLAECVETSGSYDLMFAHNRTMADMINCNAEIVITNYNDMINKLRNLYDLIIVDCPMNIDNMLCNNALYGCDTIYMVWDEGLGSIANTDRLRRNMSFCGIDSYTKMKVIINKRTYIRYNMYPITKLNVELLEILPFDVSIIENSTMARIYCEKAASNSKNAAKFANGIVSLTDKILKIGGYLG